MNELSLLRAAAYLHHNIGIFSNIALASAVMMAAMYLPRIVQYVLNQLVRPIHPHLEPQWIAWIAVMEPPCAVDTFNVV